MHCEEPELYHHIMGCEMDDIEGNLTAMRNWNAQCNAGPFNSLTKNGGGRVCTKLTSQILLLLAGTNFSVLVVGCIWQVLILAFS